MPPRRAALRQRHMKNELRAAAGAAAAALRHRLRRWRGASAAAASPRTGQAGDQPGDRDRHQRPDPAVATARLTERHRLGADRRALHARRVGHAVRRQSDQPRPVHHRRRPADHGALHDRRSVPCGPRGRLDCRLAPVPRRQAGHGSAAARRRRGRLSDAEGQQNRQTRHRSCLSGIVDIYPRNRGCRTTTCPALSSRTLGTIPPPI
jgi:hypothetical protein